MAGPPPFSYAAALRSTPSSIPSQGAPVPAGPTPPAVQPAAAVSVNPPPAAVSSGSVAAASAVSSVSAAATSFSQADHASEGACGDSDGVHVVVDSGAIIRLKNLGGCNGHSVYTTSSALREIKDVNARRHIETLPYKLITGQPEACDISAVRAFAKKTGDISVLSVTDVEIIALTLTLQREHGDPSIIRTTPSLLQAGGGGGGTVSPWQPISFPQPSSETVQTPTAAETDRAGGETAETAATSAAVCEEGGREEEAEDEVEYDDEDYDSDDGEGEWINATNVDRVGVGVLGDGADENVFLSSVTSGGPRVCCATTDYAMQNVLLQMGLRVVTVDGMRVCTVRIWGNICRACFAFTRDGERKFCSKCGHATVERVPISVDSEGAVIIHDNPKRRPRLRGNIYPIPKTKGGRNSNDLILAEDQLFMGSRARELRHAAKVYQREQIERNPFGEDMPYQTAGWWKKSPASAPFVQVGYGRGNPNSNRWRKRHNKGRH